MTAYRTKGTVSEDEVYALVQRYGASTIFTLLQEVSQAIEKDAMIDWRTLVKATSTGISNAQEYQMLWRHLAYRDPLEKVEDGGEPLSDESDLEFELEATPIPSEEISTEVDCCVKVILSSGSVGDCSPVVALNVDAPPTTDTPNDHASAVPSDKQHFGRYNRATNGAALYIQKQPLSTGTSYEGLDGNGSSNSLFPAKKKRKLWTKEEDVELIAAVEKFGEGNWANILKGDFKHDRTASQLSQRWAIIRKRQTISKQSNGSKARSEEMLAAQKAFSMALNMPMSGSLSTILSGGTQMQTTNSSTSIAGGTSGAVDEATASQASKQNQQPVNQETSSLKASSNPSNKLRTTTLKKPPSAQLKPSICPNPLIKAAAFAAGGRIATPSTAASLFKAAQSKNAVRFRHGCGSSLTGSSVNSTISSSSAAVAGTATGSAPVATVVTGTHSVTHSLNTRVTHPSVSLTSSGSALITSKLCQVQACSGKSSSLPSNTSNTSVQPLSSESRLGVTASSGTQENGKRRSVITSAIDVDEPMAEEARCERDNEASDKLVRATENGGSVAAATGTLPVDKGEINDNQCAETEQIQSKDSKEEEIRETKGSSEAMNLNSGDSKLDEEVELKAKGKSEDKGFS